MKTERRNKIRLSRETLRELTSHELDSANGGLTPVIQSQLPGCVSFTCTECHTLGQCTPDLG